MICTVASCQKEAQYSFTWPWGAPGFCCVGCMTIVTQRGQQTRGRFGAVSFVPLNPDRPREVTRDERVELHAKRLTAESERDDARVRAANLYTANTQLSNDLRVHRARCQQLEAQVKELLERIDVLVKEKEAALIIADKAREAAEDLGAHIDSRIIEDHSPLSP